MHGVIYNIISGTWDKAEWWSSIFTKSHIYVIHLNDLGPWVQHENK